MFPFGHVFSFTWPSSGRRLLLVLLLITIGIMVMTTMMMMMVLQCSVTSREFTVNQLKVRVCNSLSQYT